MGGFSTVQWFVKSMKACLKGNTGKFYSTVREDTRCFLALRCSNVRGRYVVLVEYVGDSWDGGSWQKATSVGRASSPFRGGLPLQERFYREALVMSQP